jgi:prepilin-type processing-associated H-X9-DG protein
LLVLIGIIAVLLALILSAVQRVRDSAARVQCANNLRQIGLALHAYHDSQGRLPPGVSFRNGADPYPFMSWLTRILPYVEQSPLWAQAQRAYSENPSFFASPPHLLATPVRLFGCPADPRTLQVGFAGEARLPVAFTAYLGVEGRNQYRKNGVLFLDSQVRLGDITDGTSNTLMVGERPPSADGVFGWWYAGEGQAMDGSADMVLGVRERNYYFVNVCPPGPATFGPGRVSNQCDALHFWSLHLGGGANFLFADGSVHFLPYSTATLMSSLASRAGGEAVTLPD